MNEIDVSIIIVAFHAQKKLEVCLKSIPKNKKYEVIVIDNSINNRGFGAGCNEGAQQAKGNYLFFLNPDTQLFPNTISLLEAALKNTPNVGVAAPQFLNEERTAYGSYSHQPTYIASYFRFSFLFALLPQFLKKKVHSYDFDSLHETKFVEAVSGAAFLIEKKLFQKIEGFDPQFFMYWEDYDICQKVLNEKKKILFVAEAQIVHTGGGTTKNASLSKSYFQKSRFLFFKKRFGLPAAYVLELFLRFTESLAHT